MFCARCGSKNNPKDSFCFNCGTPLGEPVAVGAAARGAHREDRGAAAAGAPVQEGVLAAAWRDITTSPNWLKKVLLLCLLGCVPVLGFAVVGYALRWSRELVFGERGPLPASILKKREILTGFRAFLLDFVNGFVIFLGAFAANLVVTGVFGLVSAQLGFAMGTVLSILIGIAFAVAFAPYLYASCMRMAVVDYLEAGFNYKKVLGALRKGPGSAAAACLVPPLAIGLVQILATVIFFGLLGTLAQGAAESMVSNMVSSPVDFAQNGMDDIARLGALASVFVFAFVVAMMMLLVFSELIVIRAMGHWAARFAPEWAREADVQAESQPSESVAKPGVRAAMSAASAPAAARAGRAAARSEVAPVAPRAPRLAEKRSAMASACDDATTIAPGGRDARVALVRLSNGRVYDLPALPATVGKGSAADVGIEQASSISRVHLEVFAEDGQIAVKDLDSTNGTSVNGVKLGSGGAMCVTDGDVIALSGEKFRVVVEKRAVAA